MTSIINRSMCLGRGVLFVPKVRFSISCRVANFVSIRTFGDMKSSQRKSFNDQCAGPNACANDDVRMSRLAAGSAVASHSPNGEPRMMNGKRLNLDSLKRDFHREDAGDWVPYTDWPGVRFKVSSLSLPAYQAAHDSMLKRLIAKYRGDTIPQREITAELGGLYAEHILHDWDGMVQPYTRETAERYLTDPEFADLIGAVGWCADKLTKVNAKFVEDAAKNSEAPSAIS